MIYNLIYFVTFDLKRYFCLKLLLYCCSKKETPKEYT